MAQKFPSLPEDKHRSLAIHVARVRVGDQDRGVVAVSELARIAIHWTRADGSWGSLTIPHDALDLEPRRPTEVSRLGWSREVGLAPFGDRLAVVYKRRFNRSSANDIWIELLEFDAPSEAFRSLGRRSLPRGGLGLIIFGFGLWADAFDGRLLVVAQHQVDPGEPAQLLLLDTTFPAQPDEITVAARWTRTVLDDGGWDLAARREGGTLGVVHRSSASGCAVDMELPLDPPFLGASATIAGEDDVAVSAGLRLVRHDLATSITVVDDALPAGTNPAVHALEPAIITMDRLRSGAVTLAAEGLRFDDLQNGRTLAMRTADGWAAGTLLTGQLDWPHYLARVASVHLATQVGDGPPRHLRVEIAPLWTIGPVVLMNREASDKGLLLTFAHQDPVHGAVRATRFLVATDATGGQLSVSPESFSILDLDNRAIRPGGDERREHIRFRPFDIDVTRLLSGTDLSVRRRLRGGNTIGGSLTTSVSRPHTFFAYTSLGDGGVRVAFVAQARPPAPTSPADVKNFQLGWVARPPEPGTEWIDLDAPRGFPTDLPVAVTPLDGSPPVSLSCGLQLALDGLTWLAHLSRDPVPLAGTQRFRLLGLDESTVTYHDLPPQGPAGVAAIHLDEPGALALQRRAEDLRPARPDIVSPPGQPFQARIRFLTSALFATDILGFRFRGLADVPPVASSQFTWTLDDGPEVAGQDFTPATVAATLPDHSRPGALQQSRPHSLTLQARAGIAASSVTEDFHAPASLWASIWAGIAALRAPGLPVAARDVSLGFYRYTTRYEMDVAGIGTAFDFVAADTGRGSYRFLGREDGQGDIEYGVPITLTLRSIVLRGTLSRTVGRLVTIEAVDATLRIRQRYTAGVHTSDVRPDPHPTETIATARRTIASAVSCIPVAPPELAPVSSTVTTTLTLLGRGLAVIVGALLAVFAAAVIVGVMAAVAPAVVAASAASPVTAIALAIVAAGLAAAVVVALKRELLDRFITSQVAAGLSSPTVRDGLLASGLLDYAGEGLAEALTRRFVAAAQNAELPVPGLMNDGRDRLRSPFIDMLVVSEGRCSAKIRW